MSIRINIKLFFLVLVFFIGCNSSTNSIDCNGIPNGSSYIDNCGRCVDLSVGANDYKDECGVCGGDGTSCEIDIECEDGLNIGCDGICSLFPLEKDECGVCGGDNTSCNDFWNIFYDVSIDIGGFQFNVEGGSIINASGGAAEDAGFTITASQSTVLAFSFSGSIIPLGEGILINLEMEGDPNYFCISNLVLSDIYGDPIPVSIENCSVIKYTY